MHLLGIDWVGINAQNGRKLLLTIVFIAMVLAARDRSRCHGRREEGGAKERFGVEPIELDPKVYYRITDNWLELTIRFVIGTHRIRGAKDAMSRYIVVELDRAGIGIASATYDIVGFPAIPRSKSSNLQAPSRKQPRLDALSTQGNEQSPMSILGLQR